MMATSTADGAPPRAADILAGLAGAGPLPTWPGHLVECCRTATLVSGVGLGVLSAPPVSSLLAATEGAAREMDDLQSVLGEGPCVEAITRGRPVLVPDLAGQAGARWPAFVAGAAARGVLAAFAFPLQVGAVGIGVLDIYEVSCGALSARQYTTALAFADAATAVLLHLQYGSAQLDDELPGPVGGRRAAGAVEVIDRRAVVHQATGMISVQLGTDLGAALVRLRGHAFATDRSVLEVASDVVARRLHFDHSAAGTVPAAPGRTVVGPAAARSTHDRP